MAKSRTWLCSSCAYWVPYPGWNGVGTCDQTMSQRYGRMTTGSSDPCDCFAQSEAQPGQAGQRGAPPGRTTCVDCHYWFPYAPIPRVGECDNPSSRHFRSPEFSDKPTEGCFVARSFEGLEFMWCESHRETIYFSELPDHKGCSVYVSSVSLPVEDEMELTLAGD